MVKNIIIDQIPCLTHCWAGSARRQFLPCLPFPIHFWPAAATRVLLAHPLPCDSSKAALSLSQEHLLTRIFFRTFCVRLVRSTRTYLWKLFLFVFLSIRQQCHLIHYDDCYSVGRPSYTCCSCTLAQHTAQRKYNPLKSGNEGHSDNRLRAEDGRDPNEGHSLFYLKSIPMLFLLSSSYLHSTSCRGFVWTAARDLKAGWMYSYLIWRIAAFFLLLL